MLTLTTNSFAVDYLKQGEPSKQDGFLFNLKEEVQLRQISEDNLTLKDLNLLQDEKIKVLQEQNVIVSTQLATVEARTGFNKYLYFALGFVSSSLVIYTSAKIYNYVKN
jgi:predicted nucleic acid-binding OB-fold protein